MTKTIGLGIVLMLILNGCGSKSEQQVARSFQNTDVSFTTGYADLQELFDSAEVKVVENIISYNDEFRFMIEGAVYPFVFLETQPMDEEYEYTQVIGDKIYTLHQKDNVLSGKVNDNILFICTAGAKIKTDLDGSVIDLVGIDSVSRNIDLSFGNNSYSFTASPNRA